MGTGHTVATLADASELPGVTVAQVNYSTVTDEVESTRSETISTKMLMVFVHQFQVGLSLIQKVCNFAQKMAIIVSLNRF